MFKAETKMGKYNERKKRKEEEKKKKRNYFSICKQYIGTTPLIISVENGRIECLNILLEAQNIEDINNQSKNNGITALMRSVELVRLECLKALLKVGVDVNKPNRINGDTALHIAARKNESYYLECIELLLGVGGDLDRPNKNEKTVMDEVADIETKE